MSILNQASDGQFSVLIALVRAAVRLSSKPKDDLLDACGRNLAAIDGGQLSNTLTRWTELGLFTSQAEVIDLAEPYRSMLGKKPDAAEAALPAVAMEIALAPPNNQRFWEAKESKSADFSRGLSWILAQDVYSLDMSTAAIIALEAEQIKDVGRRAFQNDTRWNGLRAWMAYLGFTQELGVLTVDPTDAVRTVLGAVFRSDATLTAASFVERLAAALPVLDGGEYRTQVEAVMDRAKWSPPAYGMLSTSLSRALQRLAGEGRIAFDRRSDTDGVVTLTRQGGRSWREVTHVLNLSARKGA